jgi:hypothetical protein
MAKIIQPARITRLAFRHPAFAALPALPGARGEAKDFIWERNTAPGGKLPINTNGGGLSYTHTGMYGMFALQESVRQVRGTADRKSVV